MSAGESLFEEAVERASPVMQQYYQAKKEAGGALLFFRLGDFYELFHEDARVAARVLGIALTSRGNGIPMAGVPAKAHEGYLHTLLRAGHRVALCDQVEDPARGRGLVERRVTRIVTAGTVFEDDLLDRRSSNFLAAVAPAGERCGLAWLDVSTGDFRVADVPMDRLADLLARIDPAEILLPESRTDLLEGSRAPLVRAPEWTFDPRNAREELTQRFGVSSLAGFGLDDRASYVSAAGAALAYVRETQRGQQAPVSRPRLHDPSASAALDRATRHCLEILSTQRDGQQQGSLLGAIDSTCTAMGARLLREWLLEPLVSPAAIVARQQAVAELIERREVHGRLRRTLADMPDLERVATRLLAGRGTPRDLGALRAGLRLVPALCAALQGCDSAPLAQTGATIRPLPELLDVLDRGLAEHPSPTLGEGGLIAPGWNAGLDELRALQHDGTQAIARFQADEIARTRIPSLKVGFNRVFGYYIEITHAQAAQATVPATWVRKQTLTNAERFITPELKELETRLLTAEERSRTLEAELFAELRARACREAEAVRELARAVAAVDVLAGFAHTARDRGWVRPQVDDGDLIEIHDGRHPVLETLLPPGKFVPNDTLLDRERARLVLITGPNMAGKSTYIRQVALLVLLAQVGSFVPAASAHIGVVDRIFTRIGAADDLSAGQSTFMVEMTETAAILNTATERSLVVLDEVGRGTSTWDGLSLAWAISEYLYKAVGARTLFATHYHELIELAEEFPAVRNVNVAVREWGEDIVFMHKIVAGGTDRSYGLHVARLAGVPPEVLERARRILKDLETRSPDLRPANEPVQEALFPRPGASVLDEIGAIDCDTVAPLDALLMLREWQRRLGED